MIIFGPGLILIVCGPKDASTMGGTNWKMWYFVWQDSGLVFKPHYMHKEYVIAMVPISGLLVSFAVGAAICE